MIASELIAVLEELNECVEVRTNTGEVITRVSLNIRTDGEVMATLEVE